MEATPLKVFPILSFPSSLNFNRVATLFMYGLQEKLPRSEYTCDMCKAYYMNSMIDDFGESLMTDGKSLNAFADRMLDAAADGKLRTIFDEKLGKSMEDFAKILKFNARAAEGGDLVAANIAASPLQNLGKLAKFTVLGRFLSSAPY